MYEIMLKNKQLGWFNIAYSSLSPKHLFYYSYADYYVCTGNMFLECAADGGFNLLLTDSLIDSRIVRCDWSV